MSRRGREAQSVQLLPGANAYVGGIQVRTLFFNLDAASLGAFLLFEGTARAVIIDQIPGGTVRTSIV
jgi:hypothetical protein